MKGVISTLIRIFFVSLLLVSVPAAIRAETPQASKGLPPVAQALIREGTLAVQLANALNPDSVTNDEAEAENWLGEKGISPKNGWIADYPVTPVVMGDLRESLGNAADNHKITLSRAEALQLLDSISSELALAGPPVNDSETATALPEGESLADPGSVDAYYAEEGPPVVTYYAPPPDYYYLYSWVPYPFWWGGFAFGGFFILNDFHRPVYVNKYFRHGRHHREFVSNHYRDRITNRVGRVEPGVRSAVRPSGSRGAFSRPSAGMPGVRETIRSGSGTQRARVISTGIRPPATNASSFRAMRSRPEGGAENRRIVRENTPRSLPSPVRSSAPASGFSSSGRNYESGRSISSGRSFDSGGSVPSFRGSGGGFGGGFSRGGGGGFSRGGGGGFSGGHGRR